MERFQMDNDKLKFGSIVGLGVLATSLVIGAEMSTYATMIEPELNLNSERPYEIVLENYSGYLGNTSFFSFQYDGIKIGMDISEDNYPETGVIEVPVVKRMVFQFNKPTKLEFS